MDSSDDNQSKSLFEQCIISGMNKQRRIVVGQPSSSDSDANLAFDNCKILTIPKSSIKNVRERKQKHLKHTEDKLLYDCIKVGMKSSKNVETTPVVALEQPRMETITLNSATNTAPGVEMKAKKLQITAIGTNENLSHLQQQITGFEYDEDDDNTLRDIENNEDLPLEIMENTQKQKDPNLMLKSVERLTKNFMSTAEHLRNMDSKNDSSDTWTDDYCPNGISFPVVSQNGPDLKDYDISLSITECIEDISNDRVNVIDFKVGGEVTSLSNSKPMSISSSILTNSMIANEANLIANNLLNNLSNSSQSLDIDQIRPPSCMESINYSGCFEQLLSPKLSNFRKKSLPSGIMAKRALGGKYELFSSNASTRNGSIENISSICNIDNINPPSIMDELMDSMISVSSIQSEVVDCSYESRYETAFETMNTLENDIYDDNTITLESCMDQIPNLPHDDATPIPSDMSSGESTPTKSIRKPLTPKQRRKILKDRYKTYTITSDLLNKVFLETNNDNTKSTIGLSKVCMYA